MRKNFQKIILGFTLFTFAFNSNAQCPEFVVPSDSTLSADSAMCDAVFTYSIPIALDSCGLTGSQTFSYTGAEQSFIVPAGVTSISVDAYGAQGGSNSPTTNTNYGGRVQADIPVTPGSTIFIYVGEQPTSTTGGWNGGGNGETGGIGGGGASDIRIGGNTYNDRVIVAGGAGGGGLWSGQEIHGGEGGDLVGGPGYRGTISSPGGDPGTQTASGNGTCVTLDNPVVSGGFGFGGAPSGCGCEGYGGGGGWYGGAGSGNCRGGGGGSSYTFPAATNVVHSQGVRMGHGEITISWASEVPSNYITQISGLASGSAFPVGATTNTFVVDHNGGQDTCSFVVTVVDDQIPTITCSGDITICEGESITSGTPVTSDNCPGETITFDCSGATVVSGAGAIDTVSFNAGMTTVWYYVTDAAGNQDSCSFEVTVNPTPIVALDPFMNDTMCVYHDPVTLPTGTPTTGVYSGPGVSGNSFDPSVSGEGTFYVVYTVTDTSGCASSDSTWIAVLDCAGTEELGAFATVSVYPNPSNGKFTVSFGEQLGEVVYTVSTLNGSVLMTGAAEMEEQLAIDLSTEPKGVYLLRINTSTYTKTITLMKD